jgi:hypothetical protein
MLDRPGLGRDRPLRSGSRLGWRHRTHHTNAASDSATDVAYAASDSATDVAYASHTNTAAYDTADTATDSSAYDTADSATDSATVAGGANASHTVDAYDPAYDPADPATNSATVAGIADASHTTDAYDTADTAAVAGIADSTADSRRVFFEVPLRGDRPLITVLRSVCCGGLREEEEVDAVAVGRSVGVSTPRRAVGEPGGRTGRAAAASRF